MPVYRLRRASSLSQRSRDPIEIECRDERAGVADLAPTLF
jgi:hypothetical protein